MDGRPRVRPGFRGRDGKEWFGESLELGKSQRQQLYPVKEKFL